MTMFKRVPRLAWWFGGGHMVAGGILLVSMAGYGATFGADREGAMPLPLLVAFGSFYILDAPSLWLATRLDRLVGLPPLAGMVISWLLGTVQWFLVGLLVAWTRARIARGQQVTRSP